MALKETFNSGDQLQGEVISTNGHFIAGDWDFFIGTIKTEHGNEFTVAFADGFPPKIGDTVKGTIGGNMRDSNDRKKPEEKPYYQTLYNIQPVNQIAEPDDPFTPDRPYRGHQKWNGR